VPILDGITRSSSIGVTANVEPSIAAYSGVNVFYSSDKRESVRTHNARNEAPFSRIVLRVQINFLLSL